MTRNNFDTQLDADDAQYQFISETDKLAWTSTLYDSKSTYETEGLLDFGQMLNRLRRAFRARGDATKEERNPYRQLS